MLEEMKRNSHPSTVLSLLSCVCYKFTQSSHYVVSEILQDSFNTFGVSTALPVCAANFETHCEVL